MSPRRRRARGGARPGWTRLTPARAGKLVQVWRHDASGIIVSHCGHPTAHWPWTAEQPGRDGLIVDHSGKAFPNLGDAQEAIEEWLAGLRETVDRYWRVPSNPLLSILRPGYTAAEVKADWAERETA